MYIKLIVLSIVLVGIAFLFFGIRILLSKHGYFSASSVGDSREMRRRKIYCPQIMQKIEDQKLKKEIEPSSCKDCPINDSC